MELYQQNKTKTDLGERKEIKSSNLRKADPIAACGREGSRASCHLRQKKAGTSPLNLWQERAKFIFAKHASKAKREKWEGIGTLPLPPPGKNALSKKKSMELYQQKKRKQSREKEREENLPPLEKQIRATPAVEKGRRKPAEPVASASKIYFCEARAQSEAREGGGIGTLPLPPSGKNALSKKKSIGIYQRKKRKQGQEKEKEESLSP